MNNLSLIKWHAQELHKILSQFPNDAILAEVYVQLESGILNNTKLVKLRLLITVG